MCTGENSTQLNTANLQVVSNDSLLATTFSISAMEKLHSTHQLELAECVATQMNHFNPTSEAQQTLGN